MKKEIDYSGLDGLGKDTAELLRENEDSDVVFGIGNLTSVSLGEVLTNGIDIFEVASMELAKRGHDINGDWVGFPKANELHIERVNERNDEIREKLLAEMESDAASTAIIQPDKNGQVGELQDFVLKPSEDHETFAWIAVDDMLVHLIRHQPNLLSVNVVENRPGEPGEILGRIPFATPEK